MNTPAAHTRYHPRLGRPRLLLFVLTVLALLLTGALWLWAEHIYAPVDDSAPAPWDIKHYALVVHAAFALLFVYLSGSLLQTHMHQAWQQGRNRLLGVLVSGVAFLLTASGFGLWYAGDEDLRRLSEVGHWLTGFGLPVLLLLHASAGRRGR